ncbi:MAG: hypothetical protein LBS20_07605 [Prevotella sp.]|jgi:hypothetical protein|nr:hypothetical protein [Prevotella sp.]
MGIINRDGALYMATGIDNSGLKKDAAEAEKIIDDIGKKTEDVSEKMQRTGKEIENAFDNSTDSSKAFVEELNKTGKSVQFIIEEIEKSRKATSGMFQFDSNLTGLEAAKQQLDIQKQIVAELEKQYTAAKEVFDTVNIPTSDSFIIKEREKASKLFQEIRAELEAEKQGLVELEKEYSNLAKEEDKRAKQQEKAVSKQITTLQQIRQLSEEMRSLRGTDGIVAPENVQRYDELKKKLSELGTSYRIVQQEQKALTTAGSAQLAGIVQGITGIAGAFSAGQGVASLFVKDNEKLVAIQTKLQAAMSITIGLQQVSNTLHATSSFRINTVTKVTQLWRNAQVALNTQIGIGAGLSKAFMSGGIMLLVAGITYLITQYSKWNKQQEETKRLNKIVTDSLKEAAIEGEKSAKKESISFELLYKATQNENKSKKERIKAANEIQKLYPNYFKNLSKEEILAGKGADAYNRLSTAIIASAKARAAQDKIVENHSKILDLEEQNINNQTELEKKRVTANKLANQSWQVQGAGQVSTGGISKNLIELDISKIEKSISNNEKEIEKFKKANKRLADNINIDDLLFDPKRDVKALKAGETAANKAQIEADKMREASLKLLNLQSELDSESVKQQLEYEQKLLDIEQDSFDKRYRQNQLNAAKEFLAVEEYRQKMAKAQQEAAKDIYVKNNGSDKGFNYATFDKAILPQGLRDSDIEAQVKKMTDAWVSAWKKANDDLSYEMQAFINEERLTFASELDKQIYSIRSHYKERRLLAKGNSDAIKLINSNENKDILAARLQAHQRQLEADADYNQKYLELTKNRFSSGLNLTIKSLKEQIKDQQKIFNNLEKRVLNDPNNEELADSFRNAFINIKKLNEELEKAKAEKILQMVGYAQQLASAFGDSNEQLNQASSLISSIAQGASQGGWIGAAVAVASNFIQTAVSNSEKRAAIERQILKLQDEYNISLREQNYELISSIDYARAFRDNLEALHWLIEKGFISDTNYSVWGALNENFSEANKNILLAQNNLDKVNSEVKNIFDEILKNSDLYGKIGGFKVWVQAINDWNNGLITTEEALRRAAAAGMKGAQESLDRLNSANDEVNKYKDLITELAQQMDEFATGTSFDSFLSDAATAIKDLRGNISGLADFTEEKLTDAILSSFKYQILADALKPMYDSLAKMLIPDEEGSNFFKEIDKDAISKWKDDLNKLLGNYSEELDKIFEAFGVDPETEKLSQQSSRGGFETISQDQAGSINGRLTGIHEVDLLIEHNTFQLMLLATESNQLIKGYKEEFRAIRNVLVESRFILEEIRDSNNELYEINEGIKSIKKNTDSLNKK